MPSPLDWLQGKLAAGSSLTKAPTAFPGAPAGGSVRSLSNDVARMNQRLNRDFGATGDGAVQMGPGVPPVPAPLDDSGQPRQYPYRVGWNIPSQPGEGKRVDFATLKELALTYDLMTKAIAIRQDELCSLRFDLIARDPDRKVARRVLQQQQAKIAEIRAFFERPDRVHTWQRWLRTLLWNHFVLDAVTVWKWRTLGGKLHGLRLLDGSTIKPLLSVQGDTPAPPDPAYQQYLFGVARDSFTSAELIYATKNPQSDSPYGRSPVEQFMWHVNEALRYGRARTDYFTDGTLPEGVAIAPPATTPSQLQELRQWWDAVMAGDSRQLHKLQWVPAGTAFHAFKTFEFSEPYALWLAETTAAALDVTVQQLGYQPRSSGLGGKGFSEEQTSIQERKGVKPTLRWLCDEILNPIIWQDFQAPDLQATLIDEGDEEDQLSQATAREILIRSGQVSIDQIVEEEGGTPPGIGRIFVVGNNILFEPDLTKGSLEGAHAVAAVEMDTPGEGEKPPKPPAEAGPTPDGTPTQQPGGNNADGQGSAQGQGNQAQGVAKSAGVASVERERQAVPRLPAESAGGAAAPGQPGRVQPDARAGTRPDEPDRAGDQAADQSLRSRTEIDRFLSFAQKRRKQGSWRDFQSDAIAPDVLKALNTAGKAGASADELRALAGLGEQPAAFVARVAATETAYRSYTGRLAAAVAARIEGGG